MAAGQDGREVALGVVATNATLGLPADLLIAPDGRVAAVKYGHRADDQWSVDQLLTAAHYHRAPKQDRS